MVSKEEIEEIVDRVIIVYKDYISRKIDSGKDNLITTLVNNCAHKHSLTVESDARYYLEMIFEDHYND